MATRLARRTGATVRMVMATASCAVTAALCGADERCDLAVDIKSCGRLTTRFHTPGVSTWRIKRIVGRRPRGRPINLEALDAELVYLGRRNSVRGAEPHKRRQPPANKSIADLGLQVRPCGHQRCPVLGNALFPRQPAQGAPHVAFMVLQGLGRQPSGRMV